MAFGLAGVPGSGGRGMAGGGEGNDATETLFRRLFDPELDRSSSAAGLLELRLDCLRISASWACIRISFVSWPVNRQGLPQAL